MLIDLSILNPYQEYLVTFKSMASQVEPIKEFKLTALCNYFKELGALKKAKINCILPQSHFSFTATSSSSRYSLVVPSPRGDRLPTSPAEALITNVTFPLTKACRMAHYVIITTTTTVTCFFS